MKKRNMFFKAFSLSVILTCSIFMTACGSDAGRAFGETDNEESVADVLEEETEEETNAGKEYVFEFENLDLSEAMGSGLSGAAFGSEIIGYVPQYGFEGIPEDRLPSNGRYVYYCYSEGFGFHFEIESDAADTAELTLRLGSEIGDLEDLGPDNGLGIVVNGKTLEYDPINVKSGQFNGMASPHMYLDYKISEPIELVEGTNTIDITVLKRSVNRNQAQDAPCFDCIKITTDANLTFANDYAAEYGYEY